jgi:hypothetical protein
VHYGETEAEMAPLTYVFVYGALWIAFVMTGGERQVVDVDLSWPLGAAATVILVGVLRVIGRYISSTRRSLGWNGYRRRPGPAAIAIVALVLAATELGLVVALRSMLWRGPTWLRWSVVGLAIFTMVVSSGRAWRWAVVLGLLWSALGVWAGADRDRIGRVDLVLSGAMVGTTLGAVIGTLVKSGGRKVGSGW